MSSIIKPTLGSQPQLGHRLMPDAGLWLFNEGSGGQVFDLSKNGNTGTLVGDTHWVPGKFGSALSFDGIGDYVSATSYHCNEMTISIIFNWNEPPELVTNRSFMGRFNGCDYSNENDLHVSPDGSITLHWYNTSNTYNTLTSGTGFVTTNIWYHLIVTIASGRQIFYLDGVNIATDTDSGIMKTGTALTTFGDSYGESAFWGLIDHVMIYNRALSASEIALLYREPFCMFKDPAEMILAVAGQAAGGISMPLVMQQMNQFNGGVAA